MPNTPNRQYTYPSITSPATVPADMQLALSQVDSDVQGLVDKTNAMKVLDPDGTAPTALLAEIRAEVQAGTAGLATQAALGLKRDIEAVALSTEDLDNVVVPNDYSQSATVDATLARHYPVARAGRLRVLANVARTQVTQFFNTYNSETDPGFFMRSRYAGAWGPWFEIPLTTPATPLATKAYVDEQIGSIEPLPLGDIPIFETMDEAVAWEAANPGRKALTIEPQIPDTTPPTAGTLAVTVTDITASLTVSGATDDRAVTGYAFRVGTGAWSAWQAGPAYTATGLTASTTYTFQHKVRDAAGNETLGSAVTRTTPAISPKTPAQIGSLWGHWDASVAGALTTSGTAVSAWTGTTSNARVLSQATTAQQPATTTMGGKTAVQFVRSSSDYMRHQSTFTIDATVGYTLCVVGRFDDADVTVAQSVASLAGATAITRRASDGLLSSSQNPTLDGPTSTKPNVAGEVVMMALVVRNNGTSFAWISGVAGTSKAISAGNPSTAFDLGRNAAGNNQYGSTTIGEAWVHDRPLSTSELDALRLNAQSKWGAA